MRIIAVCLIVALVGGCAYPSTGLRIPDERPSIAIEGAPGSAMLYVDGLEMGLAGNFDGARQVLLLESGKHRIEVIDRGETLLSETIFLGGGELRKLSVAAP